VIAGSFPGIHVDEKDLSLEETLILFRQGHHNMDHVRQIFGFGEMRMAEKVDPPRFAYPEQADPEILEEILRLPHRLRLPVLQAYVQTLI